MGDIDFERRDFFGRKMTTNTTALPRGTLTCGEVVRHLLWDRNTIFLKLTTGHEKTWISPILWDQYRPDFNNLDFHDPLKSRLLKIVAYNPEGSSSLRIHKDGKRGVLRLSPTLRPWSYTRQQRPTITRRLVAAYAARKSSTSNSSCQ